MELAKSNTSEKREIIISIEKFTKKLNSNPNSNELSSRKVAGGKQYFYLPISFLEMELDELFFGAWKTHSFKTSVIANEVVGSLVLEFYHPVLGAWITRVGAAGVAIQQHKGATPLEIEKKKTNAMEMCYPHLLSDCFRNAASKIGKRFGRDLNRSNQDYYKAIVTNQLKAQELNK